MTALQFTLFLSVMLCYSSKAELGVAFASIAFTIGTWIDWQRRIVRNDGNVSLLLNPKQMLHIITRLSVCSFCCLILLVFASEIRRLQKILSPVSQSERAKVLGDRYQNFGRAAAILVSGV